MDWWEKVVFPVKRAWVAVAARVKASRKSGAGILKLHDDVQTCEYQDVQVMWEMLRTEMELSHPAKRKRPVFVWSDRATSTSIENRRPHHHHHHRR